MIDWQQEPTESRHQFNPAFLAELIRRACIGHGEEAGPMPFALAFLMAPLVIYPDSRSTLSSAGFKQVHTWITTHPEVRVALAARVRALAPYIRLGIAFGLTQESLALNAQGAFEVLRRTKPRGIPVPAVDASEYMNGARTIGRWFGRAGEPSNVFLMLGLTP